MDSVALTVHCRYIRAMTHLLNFINCLVFNALLDAPKLTAELAYNVKTTITRMEQWAAGVNSLLTAAALVPLVRDQFERVIEAANVIAVEKSTFADGFDFAHATFFGALNLRQLAAILALFEPDAYARHKLAAGDAQRLQDLVDDLDELPPLKLVPDAFL